MIGRIAMSCAVHALRQGLLVAYPTEAVYGLGCDPCNEDALRRLLAVKRRAKGKGLIVIAATMAQAMCFAAPLDEASLHRLAASWPGPNTWIVPAARNLSPLLTGGRDTVAIRVSAHPLVCALCQRFGSAVVSTSANVSGRVAARSVASVRRQLGRQVAVVLGGPLGGATRPSTIRDVRSGNTVRA